MSDKWFYHCPIKNTLITLDEQESHHALHVLRVQVGQIITLFDGDGTTVTAEIHQLDRKKVYVKCLTPPIIGRKPSPPVIIACSIAKGERYDWFLTKAAELGVAQIIPLTCQRTIKQAKGKNTQDRYQRLTITAAKQAHQPYLPLITDPMTLDQAIQSIQQNHPTPCILYGALEEKAASLWQTPLQRDNALAAFIGPEGGFTEDEINTMRRHHALPVKLTRSILRIETAALTLASLLTTWRDQSV